ncbi:hypothetical protein GCM10023311_22220 [Flaviramulus aquimarinus]|uniref:Uncharacterized protein n=1 Tax=Flaviramulus aquimarinus TaxID=1170456 RepID=A0ABP9FAD5_9FLAO
MLIPKTQITNKPGLENVTSKYHAKLTMVNSIKTNQSPRFIKKLDSSFLVFLLLIIKADNPAKKLNAGAQK